MKIIRDKFNGLKWQWRYFDCNMNLWFDYGPSFPGTKKGREQAQKWLDSQKL